MNFFLYAEAKEVFETLPRDSYTAIREIQESGWLRNVGEILLRFLIILKPEKFQLMMEEAKHWFSYCQVKCSKLEQLVSFIKVSY